MTDAEQRKAARKFVQDWTGRGDEKQDTQRFWIQLLREVLGVDEPESFISFELPVKLDHTSFIDGYLEKTRVLIEQKGQDVSLKKGYRQSDGSMLTPFQQARRYAGYLSHDKNPRWIVVCNFRQFDIHDMKNAKTFSKMMSIKNENFVRGNTPLEHYIVDGVGYHGFMLISEDAESGKEAVINVYPEKNKHKRYIIILSFTDKDEILSIAGKIKLTE